MSTFRPLDLMAEHVREAASERGIKTSIVGGPGRDPDRERPWLAFTINGIDYIYANGALFERDPNCSTVEWRHINHAATLLMADKHRFKDYLTSQGFETPAGMVFRRRKLEEARAAFDKFTPPLCVKPNNGSEGKCVFTDLRDRTYFDAALNEVAKCYQNIVVEQSVVGTHFRFFYIAPNITAIRMGRQAIVFGDGFRSIQGLIDEINSERRRRALPTHPPLIVTQQIRDYLAMQNLTLDSIPLRGQEVRLAGTSNATAGADSLIVEEGVVHRSYIARAVAACRTIPGLHISGLDLVIADPSRPANKENMWFLEFNASPAILAFYYPWEGPVVDIAGRILDYLAERDPTMLS